MSKILPASIKISQADQEDLNLQLNISNHVLLQVHLNLQAEELAKRNKVPLETAKSEINSRLAEARVVLLSEIDALYGKS